MHAASADNISEKEVLAQHHGSPAGSAGLSQRASKAQQHLALEPGTNQSQNETADSEWSFSTPHQQLLLSFLILNGFL